MLDRCGFKRYFLGCLLALFLLPAAGLQANSGFDHSPWDAFLKKFVNEKGEVNYQAVKADPTALDDYLKSLSTVTEKTITAWPREEAIAFWINAYHAYLIKMVSDNYPVSSVTKIPGFWDVAAVRIKGVDAMHSSFSLNDVRKSRLVGFFHDEKIDFALSMAAKGGPRLSRDAFTGLKVEGQLFLLARQFVKDPFFVEVIPGRKKIRISKLFQWYAKDFKLNFGTPSEPLGKFSPLETAVLSFIAHFLEDEAKEEYLQDAKYKIEYPPFDWTLNDWKTNTTQGR